jgi:hypothetical protein
MSDWIDSKKDTCSGHGERILNQCKCNSGYEGDLCEEQFVSIKLFTGVSALATLVLMLAVLVIGACSWRIFLTTPVEKSRPIGI